jgi:hypothetical protein
MSYRYPWQNGEIKAGCQCTSLNLTTEIYIYIYTHTSKQHPPKRKDSTTRPPPLSRPQWLNASNHEFVSFIYSLPLPWWTPRTWPSGRGFQNFAGCIKRRIVLEVVFEYFLQKKNACKWPWAVWRNVAGYGPAAWRRCAGSKYMNLFDLR